MQEAGKIRLAEHNTAVVANAANVVILSLGELMGKKVSRKLNGATVSDEALTSLVVARMKNKLGL
ncbi:hypothetical protein D3C78_1939430 [compost metagenome]